MTEQVLKAVDVVKVYHRGSEKVRAVDGVTAELYRGEFVSVMGPSGSGKTTLVNILGCLDNPTSGVVDVMGRQVFGPSIALNERKMTRIRRESFGYVFQKFHLIPTLTVRENVMLPLTFFRKAGVGEDADRLMDLLGILHRAKHLPGELSGGEMQRTAIARALVNKPAILLADEPTGNLDSKRSDEIGKLLCTLRDSEGLTILLVTHNPALAAMGDRVLEIRDGLLKSIE